MNKMNGDVFEMGDTQHCSFDRENAASNHPMLEYRQN